VGDAQRYVAGVDRADVLLDDLGWLARGGDLGGILDKDRHDASMPHAGSGPAGCPPGDSGEHPVILREAVTSPGGTTISAIRELERHSVRAAFLEAIEAARDRAAELGTG